MIIRLAMIAGLAMIVRARDDRGGLATIVRARDDRGGLAKFVRLAMTVEGSR